MAEITAVITCHDERAHIVDAVDSALAQADPPATEVLVIDDGSRDGSAELLASRFVEEARLRIISQPNTGLSGARNRGLAEARTPWVAFLDGDDRWLPGRLTAAAEVIRHRPHVSLVYGDLHRVGGRRPGIVEATDFERTGPTTREAILSAAGPVTPSTYTVNVADALAVGGFDMAMVGVEDVDFALRVAAIGDVVRVARPLVVKADRAGSMSKNRRRRFENTRRMVERAVAVDPVLRDAGQVRISWAESKLARHLARDGEVRAALAHATKSVIRTPRFGHAWRTLVLAGAVSPLMWLRRRFGGGRVQVAEDPAIRRS